MAVKASQVEESSWSQEILEAGLLDQHWLGIKNALKTGQDYPGLQHYGVEDEMVNYERRIHIPDSNALKLKVAYQCHNAKLAGHFGRDKTLDLMKRNYYWPNMEEWVRNYVRACDACQPNKTERHKKYGKLVPLEIPSRPWEQISMDFTTDLPNIKGYNQCWVIVDRFTKMANFIPVKNRKAKELALIFVREVWRLHELPKRVVSDRDTVFMSSFWSEVMRLLEVELDKSSAYHPQTDGQTERVNQILEHYLRTYCMWDQDDWVDLPPFAEFCYNNTVHTATKQAPFFAAYYQHPENNLKNPRDNATESNNPEAVKTAEDLDTMREAMRENMKAAQTRMAKYYNQKVANKKPQFKVGDWVMVNAKNIKTKRPSKKLDYKLSSKLEIEKLCGTNAYRLKLPPLCGKIHPVLHISLLEPYCQNTIPGRR